MTQLIVVLGPGGVGKTTCSAAIAIAGAQRGLRTVVMTVDPAKRLAQALGLQGLSSEPQPVPLSSIMKAPSEMFTKMARCDALWIDQSHGLEKLARRHISDSSIADRVVSHRLFQIVDGQLGGVEEYVGIEKTLQILESQSYDLCILDTPPNRHAIDFLISPEHLIEFFEGSIIKDFVSADEEPTSWNLSSVLQIGRKQGVSLFKNLLGRRFFQELNELLDGLKPLYHTLQRTASQIQTQLKSPQSQFVLLSAPEPYSEHEALEILKSLRSHQLPDPTTLVLNRCLSPHLSTPTAEQLKAPLIRRLWTQHQAQFEVRQRWTELQKSLASNPDLVFLPRRPAHFINLELLSELGNLFWQQVRHPSSNNSKTIF